MPSMWVDEQHEGQYIPSDMFEPKNTMTPRFRARTKSTPSAVSMRNPTVIAVQEASPLVYARFRLTPPPWLWPASG